MTWNPEQCTELNWEKLTAQFDFPSENPAEKNEAEESLCIFGGWKAVMDEIPGFSDYVVAPARSQMVGMTSESQESMGKNELKVQDLWRELCNNFEIRPEVLTIIHGHTPLLNSTHIAAQFILSVRVLDEFRLHTESPHLVQSPASQFHLIEKLGSYFHHFMRRKLLESNQWTLLVI